MACITVVCTQPKPRVRHVLRWYVLNQNLEYGMYYGGMYSTKTKSMACITVVCTQPKPTVWHVLW